jgi:hypothetical protein
VGAANEARSSRDKVSEFTRSLDIRFPVWMEASADHMDAFGVGGSLPATAIVDPQGRVAARIKGVTDEKQLRSLVDRVLLESAPVPSALRAANPTGP